FGDERIVVWRNRAFGVGGGVDAHTRPSRRIERGDLTRRGREFLRMLGIDAALDGVSAMHDGALQHVGQLFARGDHDLALHQVHVRNHLGDGMLHLDARVHLDEVKPPVFFCARVRVRVRVRVHEEFDGAGIVVADLAERFADDVSDFLAQLGRHLYRRRLLDQLLVAPLNRALAFSQADNVAVLVAQHLELDVARVLDIAFQVKVAVAEGARGLRLRLTVKAGQLIFIAHYAHAAPPAPRRGLEDDRKADLTRPLARFFIGGDHAVRAGKDGHAVLFHGGASFFFFAHQPDDIGSGSDELDVTAFADFGEVGVLRKQAVTGMDGVHVGDFGGADHRGNVEITLRQLRRANANRLIGKAHMQRIAIRFTVDCDGPDAEFLACANDAQRDLAAIRYQNFLEHDGKALSCQPSAIRKPQDCALVGFS